MGADLLQQLMTQGSLRDVLEKKGENLPWALRHRFAMGAAKGM